MSNLIRRPGDSPRNGEEKALVELIDTILPQTQCRQCGYAGCRPYAAALAGGDADIDQCPPGGEEGVRQLADLLGMPAKRLNPAHGSPKPPSIAWIDETLCIGCTLCIRACPVDAIVGAAKLMHTVVVAECTGCELCIAPCPVDCIALRPREESFSLLQKRQRADSARRRHDFRARRLDREKAEREERLAAKHAAARAMALPTIIHGIGETAPADAKNAAIARAIERAKARKASVQNSMRQPMGQTPAQITAAESTNHLPGAAHDTAPSASPCSNECAKAARNL